MFAKKVSSLIKNETVIRISVFVTDKMGFAKFVLEFFRSNLI